MTTSFKSTVLLVDDNQAHLTALANALSARGFEVMSVTTAEEARLAGRGKFDAIAVDILMDGNSETGLWTIKGLREQDRSRFITGCTGTETSKPHAMQFGANDLVYKLFDQKHRLKAEIVALEIEVSLLRHREWQRNKIRIFFMLLVYLPLLLGIAGTVAACLGHVHFPPLNDWGVRSAPALFAVLVVLTVSARFGGKDPYIRDHPAFLHLRRAQAFMLLGTLLPGLLYDILKYLFHLDV